MTVRAQCDKVFQAIGAPLLQWHEMAHFQIRLTIRACERRSHSAELTMSPSPLDYPDS